MAGKNNHEWTKDEIKKVISLWTSKSLKEIGTDVGVNAQQVAYIAGQIRKSGFNLQKKTIKGNLRSLIGEAIKEI